MNDKDDVYVTIPAEDFTAFTDVVSRAVNIELGDCPHCGKDMEAEPHDDTCPMDMALVWLRRLKDETP